MESLKNCFLSSPRKSIKTHTYFQVYEELLGKYIGKHFTLVEIGVLDGGSLHMWRNYFGPLAKIIGIEFNQESARLATDEFIIEVGDQGDINFWNNFFLKHGPVDVVIDDGGHWNDQQIITTVAVIPNIKPGGMLIVEDTHCSYYSWMGNPSKYSFIEYTKYLVDTVNYRYESLDKQRPGFASKYIYSIRFYESIVVFLVNKELCVTNKPLSNLSKITQNKALGTESSLISLYEIQNPIVRILKRLPWVGNKIAKYIQFRREKLRLSSYFDCKSSSV